MTRLLPLLRRHAGVLAALAMLAFLAPALAQARSAAPGSEPFSLVICTADGVVSLPLGQGEEQRDAGGDREHCPACLRQDLAEAPPPVLAPPRAEALRGEPPRRAVAAAPAAPDHLRPDKTGPPARL